MASAVAWLKRRWRQIGGAIRRRPLLAALFVIGFVAESIPIWVTEILPQGDIYQHLAIVEVIHDYDAPDSVYSDFFELPDSIKPNLAYYYVVDWLGYLMPLEVANKLFLNLYVLLLPLSLLWFLTTFGRPRRLALFGYLFIYSGLFRTGFAGYLVSIPLYFFGIAEFYRWSVKPTLRRGVANGLLASLLFFTHAQMYLLYMLTVAYMGLFLWRPGGLRRYVQRLLAPATSLAFFLPWFLSYFIFWKAKTDVMGLAGPEEGFGATWHTPEVLFSRLFMYLQGYFRDTGDEYVMLGILFLMLIGFVLRGHREASPVAGESSEPELPWTHRYLPEMVSLLLAVSIFALPVHIKNQAVISTRHIPLFAISAIPWLGWFRRRRASAVFAGLVIALAVAQSAYTARRFLDYERELDDYKGLFSEMRPWSRLWKVSGGDLSSNIAHGNVYWHLHYNFMLWKGGITDVQFAQYVTCPVRYKPDAVPPYLADEPHKTNEWQFYDYFLVQKSQKSRVHGLLRWLKVIGENHYWILYERRDRPFDKWFDLDRWSPPVPKPDARKDGDRREAAAAAKPPAPAPGTALERTAAQRGQDLHSAPVPQAPRRLPPHLGRRSKNSLKPLPGPKRAPIPLLRKGSQPPPRPLR